MSEQPGHQPTAPESDGAEDCLPPTRIARRPTHLFRRLDRTAPRWLHRLSVVAASLMLAVMGLALLHFLAPNPVTLALLMAVGNAGFVVALACYVVVVVVDLRRRRAL